MRIAETGHLTFATLHTNNAFSTLNRIIDIFPSAQQGQVRQQLSLVLEGILCQALLPKMGGKGRAMALEVLVPNTAIRSLIREDKVHQIYSMMQTGQEKYAMQTFNQALAQLYFKRAISLEVAMQRSSNADELKDLIERTGGGGPGRLPRRACESVRSRAPDRHPPLVANFTEKPPSRFSHTLGRPFSYKFVSEQTSLSARLIRSRPHAYIRFQRSQPQREVIVGERTADNREVLRQMLRREQVILTSVKEKGRDIAVPKLSRAGRVNAKELALFTRQFSVMIDAGLPLVQAIDILAQQQSNGFFKGVLLQVKQDVEEGATLAGAMARHPRVFDNLFTNLIDAGETGGMLDIILQRLSTYIEKIVKLKRDVISAMIYPTAVIVIAVGVIAVIMVIVIPQFQNIFLGLLGPGEVLPLPTRIVVGISDFVAGWGGLIMLLSGIAGVTALYFYRRTPKGHYNTDAALLKIPIIGIILLKVGVARFSRTLSTLLSSGVPILQSLEITARTAGNKVLEEGIIKVRDGVERGESFVDPLRAAKVFPLMVAQMIGIGEQTGALDAMLGKIADFYEQEVDTAIANLLTLIEPVMIGFLGVTIGGIVIAMYLPLFTLVGKLASK
ncbi:MAG: type II secretion system F family protein [Pyrinomonadaceae bacterium]